MRSEKIKDIKERMNQTDEVFIRTARMDMSYLLDAITSLEMDLERAEYKIEELKGEHN
ncbi:hypothetical protein ACOMCU_01470 [Lysinibacillus sp. UGB7]|uniref:hypothetical protein n=1 Tax=Lysinibacillus sp. UGB7 TaxID=3411039 RepID=UPI003B76A839